MAASALAADIERVRSFNRLVTRQIGVLDDPYRGRRPLGECRVLYEIGAGGATKRDVRARLGLDPAYLARLIESLERDRLVEVDAREPSLSAPRPFLPRGPPPDP